MAQSQQKKKEPQLCSYWSLFPSDLLATPRRLCDRLRLSARLFVNNLKVKKTGLNNFFKISWFGAREWLFIFGDVMTLTFDLPKICLYKYYAACISQKMWRNAWRRFFYLNLNMFLCVWRHKLNTEENTGLHMFIRKGPKLRY